MHAFNIFEILIKKDVGSVYCHDCHIPNLALVDTLTQCLKSVNHYGGQYIF